MDSDPFRKGLPCIIIIIIIITITLVPFTLLACMSTHFKPEYINFHMSGVLAHKNLFLEHTSKKTRCALFSGTPCSLLDRKQGLRQDSDAATTNNHVIGTLKKPSFRTLLPALTLPIQPPSPKNASNNLSKLLTTSPLTSPNLTST